LRDGDSPVVAEPPGAAPSTDADEPPPQRPAPQSTLRKCGTPRTVPEKLDTRFRVVASKPNPKVSSLLSATKCTTADLAACKKLVDDLHSALDETQSDATHSDLAKLQAGTDPTWATVAYLASPVSILEP
jgi:hypothetical protein